MKHILYVQELTSIMIRVSRHFQFLGMNKLDTATPDCAMLVGHLRVHESVQSTDFL